MPPADVASSILVRRVMLVPVRTAPATTDPVDVRIDGGVVTQVEPSLVPLPGERVVDADGRHAIPGLWDQHVHLQQWAQAASRLDLRGTIGPDDVVRVVAEHLASLPRDDVAPLVGFGHRSTGWPRPATVAELDAVSHGRPVVLVAGDGHHGWLNTAALSLFGLTGVTGLLEENDWFPVFARLGELPGADESADQGYGSRGEDAARRGVVGVVDFEFGSGFRDWPARVQRGIDHLRVRTAVYADGLDDVIAAGLRTGDPLPGGLGLAEMGPLKIIADGSLSTGTAACCEPYADASAAQQAHGAMNLGDDELLDLLRRAHRHGLDVAVHAIGDAAVSRAVDAFERSGARGSIEHAQLVVTPDIARMARLGVRASVQPAHLLDDRDATERSWPDRTGRCFVLRSMLDAGVTLALGSDAPVAPLDPWLAMAAAVHRSGDERPAWHPEQAISPQEALAASTDGQDTIAVGSRGDLVLLDDDPLRDLATSEVTARYLRSMSVAATVVGGRVTHLGV